MDLTGGRERAYTTRSRIASPRLICRSFPRISSVTALTASMVGEGVKLVSRAEKNAAGRTIERTL